MTDAKEFKNCVVNIEERICILMLHLFIYCSINYPVCAELNTETVYIQSK